MKQAKRQMAGSGEALPAGSIGEAVSGSITSLNQATTADVNYNISSLNLTAGTWIIYRYVYSLTPALNYVENYLSDTNSGRTLTGIVAGSEKAWHVRQVQDTERIGQAVTVVRYTGNKTVYLNFTIPFVNTNVSATTGYFYAVRIA